ncbi:hypothetical protein H072_3741 [Dactylellina haptotyla CBS 200.50]|uniref:Uncharacterized protein n=1 Tax=Dactylellina haptotyla (strain CBS 200.50) TaxID=1284197 RepID=S8AHC4_DACHA|nr:hypothetical protein H072_3741 [Dactylellina haptotyla CBS 200.50]
MPAPSRLPRPRRSTSPSQTSQNSISPRIYTPIPFLTQRVGSTNAATTSTASTTGTTGTAPSAAESPTTAPCNTDTNCTTPTTTRTYPPEPCPETHHLMLSNPDPLLPDNSDPEPLIIRNSPTPRAVPDPAPDTPPFQIDPRAYLYTHIYGNPEQWVPILMRILANRIRRSQRIQYGGHPLGCAERMREEQGRFPLFRDTWEPWMFIIDAKARTSTMLQRLSIAVYDILDLFYKQQLDEYNRQMEERRLTVL